MAPTIPNRTNPVPDARHPLRRPPSGRAEGIVRAPWSGRPTRKRTQSAPPSSGRNEPNPPPSTRSRGRPSTSPGVRSARRETNLPKAGSPVRNELSCGFAAARPMKKVAGRHGAPPPPSGRGRTDTPRTRSDDGGGASPLQTAPQPFFRGTHRRRRAQVPIEPNGALGNLERQGCRVIPAPIEPNGILGKLPQPARADLHARAESAERTPLIPSSRIPSKRCVRRTERTGGAAVRRLTRNKRPAWPPGAASRYTSGAVRPDADGRRRAPT